MAIQPNPGMEAILQAIALGTQHGNEIVSQRQRQQGLNIQQQQANQSAQLAPEILKGHQLANIHQGLQNALEQSKVDFFSTPEKFDSAVEGIKGSLGTLSKDEDAVLRVAAMRDRATKDIGLTSTTQAVDRIYTRRDVNKARESTDKPIEDDREYRDIQSRLLTNPSSVTAEQKAKAKAYEKQKTLGPVAGANIRLEGLMQARTTPAIDKTSGELTFATPEMINKEPNRYVPAGPGASSMSKEAQFSEMKVASGNARSAIQNLDKPFTAPQIAKLRIASTSGERGVFGSVIETMVGTQQLTEKQQDFLVWINQLNERALSLRNVAGMGQGAEDLRKAIQRTLPSALSGNKELMMKQLDAFDNQVSLLEKGIPKSGVNTGNTGTKSQPKTAEEYLRSKGINP